MQNQSYSCKYCDLKFATIIKAKIHQRCHKDEKTNSSNSYELNKEYENMKKPNVALDSSKSLENEFKTFKLPKNHGNNFIQAGQSIVKNEAIYHSKDLIIEKVTNECKHCGKNFSERSVLEIHERSHTSNLDVIHDFQSFGCFYCDKKFANKIQVENHEKIHTGDKSVALDSPKSLASDFKTFKLTKNHGNQFVLDFQSSVKNEGNDDTKEVTNETVPLECKYCGKIFSDRMALKIHEKIHTMKNLSYNCNFCEKKFATSTQAKNHEKVHTGEKPYSCDFCPRTFAQKGNAKIHQMRCLDLVSPKPIIENPKNDVFESSEIANNTFSDFVFKTKASLSCKYCGATYEKKRELKKHEKLHSAGKNPTIEKTFGCNYCDKMFANSAMVKNHERVHTGEKPYSCNYCQKSFSQRNNLKTHER